MFARTIYSVLLLTAPLVAVAGSIPRPTGATPASQCNVSNLQCCGSTEEAHSPSSATKGLLTGLMGLELLEGLTAQIAKGCSPLTVVGLGNGDCSAQPVCCSNNTFNGVVALGCTPVNINL